MNIRTIAAAAAVAVGGLAVSLAIAGTPESDTAPVTVDTAPAAEPTTTDPPDTTTTEPLATTTTESRSTTTAAPNLLTALGWLNEWGYPNLADYCYSDCTRVLPDRVEMYMNLTSEDNFRLALMTMEPYSRTELDDLCNEFWAADDDDLLDDFAADGLAGDLGYAALGALWLVCDT
jgi:hypothetical protein